MEFPTPHNNFQKCPMLQLPEELDIPGYAYSSSSESDGSSPIFTPGYSSPLSLHPMIYDGVSFPHRLTDMYRRDHDQTAQNPTWTCQEGYYDQPGIAPSPTCPVNMTFSSGLPLHAPIPLPGHSGLLFSDAENFNYPAPRPHYPHQPFLPLNYAPDADSNSICQPQENYIQPDCYSNAAPPPPQQQQQQQTFLTPSELLVELAAQDTGAVEVCAEPVSEKKSETARRARQRAMADSIGFVPTDPDSISSHEKKRHYLECLEQYVMYLHEQLNLVGAEPVALERVSSYRGLSSRSIRTLLVHMENTTRKLNLRTLSEEQTFVVLRDDVFKQDAAAVAAVQEYQRHSISSTPAGAADDTLASYPPQ